MTERNDGSAVCDSCNKDLPNASGMYAVALYGWTPDLYPLTLHVCANQPNPCAPKVFTREALSGLPTAPVFYSDGA